MQQSWTFVDVLGKVGVPLSLGVLGIWLEWRRRRRSNVSDSSSHQRRRISVSLFSINVEQDSTSVQAREPKRKPHTRG